MANKTLAWVAIIVSVVVLAGGLVFLMSANRASRFLLAFVLLGMGVALVAWGGTTLRRLRSLDPERVADRIIELVRRRGATEITQADIVGSLGVSNEIALEAIGVLSRRQAIERRRHEDRDIFYFPQLRESRAVRRCPYCGSEFSVKTPLQKCPNCGANLEVEKK
jgi:Zn finger protein HypA/HybF involved in hydrogenase expression